MPEFDTYLLVHPDRWPSFEDGDSIFAGELDPSDLPAGVNLDALFGARVTAAAGRARRRAVILDPYEIERLCEDAHDEMLCDDEADASLTLDALAGIAAGPGGEALLITEDVPVAGWELAQADPLGVVPAAKQIMAGRPAGARVLVGGFARHDCVARAVAALRRCGFEVTVCDTSCLPVPVDAVERFLGV